MTGFKGLIIKVNLSEQIVTKETIDLDELEGYAKEWQQLAYEEQPSITIKYDQEGVVIDPTALEAEQFRLHHYPNWPRVLDWKLNPSTTQDTIVLAQTGPAPSEGLNPYLTTSYYDLVVFGAVFEALTKRENLDKLKSVSYTLFLRVKKLSQLFRKGFVV